MRIEDAFLLINKLLTPVKLYKRIVPHNKLSIDTSSRAESVNRDNNVSRND